MNKLRTMMMLVLAMILTGCPPTVSPDCEDILYSDHHESTYTYELDPLVVHTEPGSNRVFIEIEPTTDCRLLQIFLPDRVLAVHPSGCDPVVTYELLPFQVQVLSVTDIDSIVIDGVELDIDLLHSKKVFSCLQ